MHLLAWCLKRFYIILKIHVSIKEMVDLWEIFKYVVSHLHVSLLRPLYNSVSIFFICSPRILRYSRYSEVKSATWGSKTSWISTASKPGNVLLGNSWTNTRMFFTTSCWLRHRRNRYVLHQSIIQQPTRNVNVACPLTPLYVRYYAVSNAVRYPTFAGTIKCLICEMQQKNLRRLTTLGGAMTDWAATQNM